MPKLVLYSADLILFASRSENLIVVAVVNPKTIRRILGPRKTAGLLYYALVYVS